MQLGQAVLTALSLAASSRLVPASLAVVGSHLSGRPALWPSPKLAPGAQPVLLKKRVSPKKQVSLKGLGPQKRPKLLAMGPSAANFVCETTTEIGRVVVKSRVDPRESIAEEAFALRHAPMGVGPALLAAASHEVLCAIAVEAGDFSTAKALDVLPTESLVLQHLPGTSPTTASTSILEEIARVTSALHRVRPKKGPSLRVGESLLNCARLSVRLVQTLTQARVLTTSAAKQAKVVADELLKRSSKLTTSTPKLTALCHGDLRLHNMLAHQGKIALIDFEHAGCGDPAMDIALFRARAPLDDDEELVLLDAYLDASFSPGKKEEQFFLDRYRVARPLALALSGLAGTLDLLDVRVGARRIESDIGAFVDDKLRACEEDLGQAFTCKVALSLPKAPSPQAPSPKAPSPKRRHGIDSVAVDGTSASGKSILAEAAADSLLLPWFNTGVAFRYVALRALELDIDLDTAEVNRQQDERQDEQQTKKQTRRVLSSLKREKLTLRGDGRLVIDGVALSLSLEVIEVERVVAKWAAQKSVRDFLRPTLLGAISVPAVVEGRAVTTSLWPSAHFRAFVDASLAVRARRTFDRLWSPPSLGEVKRMLAARDTLDCERSVDPLIHVSGVKFIDTTRGSKANSVDSFLAALSRANPRKKGSKKSSKKSSKKKSAKSGNKR